MELDEKIPVEKEPLVSVLMVSYNGLPYIEEAVACITNQTYTNWELIISDDASTDGTSEWLEKKCAGNPQIKLFIQKKNLGYVGNKNFVHKKASGLYITQQDQDDLCAPDRLELQVSYLQSHPQIKIIGSGYSRISEDGSFIDTVAPKNDTLIDKAEYREFHFWYPGLLIHKDVFQSLGYFDEYFSGVIGDDMYWAMKAVRRFPIFCLSKPLYQYRSNPTSITNSFSTTRKLVIPKVLEELFKQQELTGTDWLQQGNYSALKKLEEDLEKNKSFMSAQFQIGAAKAIDNNNFNLAIKLMKKSFWLNPLNGSLYRTLLYLIRNRLKISA